MLIRIKLFFLLVLSVFQLNAQQDPLNVIFTATSAPTTGAPLEVEVRVADFTDLFVAQYFILWDSTVLQVDTIPFISNALGGFFQNNITLPAEDNENPAKGKLRVGWGDANPVSLPDSTHLFTIRFTTIGQPCAETNLSIGAIGTQQSQIIEVINGSFQEIGAIASELPIMVPGNNCNASPPVTFNFPSVTADAGDNVCIPLTVMQFDSIDSFGGSVAWNPSVLQFTGIQGFGFTDLDISNFGVTAADSGSLNYGWFDDTGSTPVTLAGGSTLFEVCFDVIGAAGTSSTVVVTDDPNVISVTMSGPTSSDPSIPLTFAVGTGSINVAQMMMADPVGFNVPNISANQGNAVCIPVTVTNFDNVSSFSGSMLWNSPVLEFVGVMSFGVTGLAESNFDITQVSNGTLTYSWNGPAESLPDGATLFEVCYNVIGNPGQSTDILVTGSPQPIVVVSNGEEVLTTTGSGSLSIPPDTSGLAVIFTMPDLSGNNGDMVCIPVTLDNFNNIISANGSIQWDPEVLTYTGTQSYGLPGFNPNSNLNTTQTADGRLSFVWAEPNNEAATLPDGTVMIELCFDVNCDMVSNTALEFGNTPTAITVGQQLDPTLPSTDAEFEIVNGSFTVLEGCGTTGGGEDDVIFTIPELCVTPGTSSVCVPITVMNFVRISQVDFSLMWDPAILAYDETMNADLFGFNPASQMNLAQVDDGKLSFSWFDGSGANPQTIADGGTMIEFCFDVTGNENDKSLVEMFSGTIQNGLTPIAVGQAGEGPLDPTVNIGHQENNGCVSIVTKTSRPFRLDIEQGVVTNPNQLACVDFVVEGFDDLVITQWTVRWDSTALCFNEVRNIHPNATSLTTDNFFLDNTGQLKIAWSDLGLSGKTIPDGNTYYQVCFDVKMDCGGSTDISVFEDTVSGAIFNVTNEENQVESLPYTFSNGGVEVDCMGGTGLEIANAASVTDVDCFDECTGRIAISFSGGTGPYSCTWSGPNGYNSSDNNCPLTPSISNLCAGSYTVTVRDANGESATASFTVNQPDRILINASITNVTCNANGEIRVNPSGGSPPYTIVPNNLTNLAVGSYRVEVRDANGCEVFQFYNIEDDCPTTEPLRCNVTVIQQALCGVGGIIMTTATGGTPPYQTFYTTNEFGQNISNLSNVPPGTYTATCRDSRGEEATRTFTVLDQNPTPLRIRNFRIVTQAGCDGTGGVIDYDIEGGCPPVRCEISRVVDGVCVGTQSCSQLTSLIPSDYKLVLTDAQGNEARRDFEIFVEMGEPISLEVLSVVAAGPCLDDSGSAQITVSGGCGPITCSIDGLGDVPCNQTIAVPAGNYFASATDGLTQAIPVNFVIDAPTDTVFVASPIVSDENCMIDADVILGGGTAPFMYQWYGTDPTIIISTDPVLTIDPENLEDAYSLTVIDANGCRYDFDVSSTSACVPTVDSMDTTIIITELAGGITGCAGQENCEGAITAVLNQQSFTGPYLIEVTDQSLNVTSVLMDTTGTIEIPDLCAGSYDMAITDALGNTTVVGVTVVVEGPEPLAIDIITQDCTMPDVCSGEIEIGVSGGTAPYTLLWTNGTDTLDASFVLDSLCESTYLVEVTDANGCSLPMFINIDCCDGCPPPSTTGCDGKPVITPNGDNLNDTFFIDCATAGDALHIYDRWGRAVYSGEYMAWDGRNIDGDVVPEGAYYWVLEQEDSAGLITIEKGTVTLLRNQ